MSEKDGTKVNITDTAMDNISNVFHPNVGRCKSSLTLRLARTHSNTEMEIDSEWTPGICQLQF
jgi:hypothetical protein